jgi:hypothetical protein
MPVPFDPNATPASQKTSRFAAMFRQLNLKGAALQAISKADAQAGQEIGNVVRQAPKQVVSLVRNAVLEAKKAVESGGQVTAAEREKLSRLERAALAVSGDPQTASEAADALDALGRALQADPGMNRLIGRALDELDDKGILGEGILASIVELFGAIAGGAGVVAQVLAGGDLTLKAGPVRLSVNRVGKFSASLRIKNPLWAKMAVDVAIQASPKGVEGASVSVPFAKIPTGAQGRGVTLAPYVSATGLGTPKKEVEGGVKAGIRFGGSPVADDGRVLVAVGLGGLLVGVNLLARWLHD